MTQPGGAPRVIVAHDSDTIREALRRQLADAGYDVTVVADGGAAARALETRPAALVIDVAVSGVFAYELLERVKAAGGETKTVLVASVYNRTGYKRRPTSLYGADDYVEQHHIPDQLVPKIEKLIGPAPKRPAAPSVPDTVENEAIRDAGEARLKIRYANKAEGIQRARRLARLIIADIALYNGGALTSREEVDARLRLDVEEGRLLFDLRVPQEIRVLEDFIGEALAEWYRREQGDPR